MSMNLSHLSSICGLGKQILACPGAAGYLGAGHLLALILQLVLAEGKFVLHLVMCSKIRSI